MDKEELELFAEVLSARVENKALERVEKCLREERERSTQQMNQIIGASKWIGGVAFIVLGILGWTQWSSIRSSVEGSIEGKLKSELDATFRIGDANSPLRSEINRYVGDSLVSGLMLERMLLDRATYMHGERRLSPEERGKIRDILQDPATSDFTFQAGVALLNRYRSDDSHADEVLLGDLLTADRTTSKVGWMAESNEKRLAILNQYPSEYVLERSLALLKPTGVTPLTERIMEELVGPQRGSITYEAIRPYCEAPGLVLEQREYCLAAQVALEQDIDDIAGKYEEVVNHIEKEDRDRMHIVALGSWRILRAIGSRFDKTTNSDPVNKLSNAVIATLIDCFEAGEELTTDIRWPDSQAIFTDNDSMVAMMRMNYGGSYQESLIDLSYVDGNSIKNILRAARQRSATSLAAVMNGMELKSEFKDVNNTLIAYQLVVPAGGSLVVDGGRKVAFEQGATVVVTPRVKWVFTDSQSKGSAADLPTFSLVVNLPGAEGASQKPQILADIPSNVTLRIRCNLSGCDEATDSRVDQK